MNGVSDAGVVRALRHGVVASLYVLPVVPLVVTPWLYYPFITGKALLFRAVVEIAFGGWVALALLDPGARPGFFRGRWSDSVIPLVGLIALAVLGVTTLTSLNPGRSFWSTFERMEGLITHLHLAALFVVLRGVFVERAAWTRWLNTSFGVSAIVCVWALGAGGERLEGPFGTPAFLASYLLAHVFSTVWVWLRTQDKPWANVYLGLGVLQVVTLLGTATRAAVVALAVGGLLLTGAVAWENGARVGRRVGAAMAIGLGATLAVYAAACAAGAMDGGGLLSRSAEALSAPDSRLAIWRMALRGVAERPFAGWGGENFTLVYSAYEPASTGTLVWVDRAHAAPLEWAIGSGVLGLVSYIALFGAALWVVWRPSIPWQPWDRSALTALVGAVFVFNLFWFDNLVSYLVAVGVLAFLDGRRAALERRQPVLPGRRAVLVAFGAVSCAVVTMIGLNAGTYQAARETAGLIDPRLEPAHRVRNFERVVALDTAGTAEALEAMALTLLPVVVSTQSLPRSVREDFLHAAERAVIRQAERHPTEARTHYVVGLVLARAGKPQRALVRLERARALAPRLPTVLVTLAQAQVAAKQPQQALRTAQTAFEMNPAIRESRVVYALTAVAAGDVGLAGRLLGVEAPVRSSALLDDRLVHAYSVTGQADALAGLWASHASDRPVFEVRLYRYVRRLQGRTDAAWPGEPDPGSAPM